MKISASLDTLSGKLGEFLTAEARFLQVGEALAAIAEHQTATRNDFSLLASKLAEEGPEASADLGRAVDDMVLMAKDQSSLSDDLSGLVTVACEAEVRLKTQFDIAKEIRSVGTAAKIQAAQVNAADIDFSVFTTEIERMTRLIETAIDRATDRIGGLKCELVGAIRSDLSNRDLEQRELATISMRLDETLRNLAERRAARGDNAREVSDRLQGIHDHIGAIVARLQFNDIAVQRIDHIQHGLKIVGRVVTGASFEGPDSWINDCDAGRRQAIAVAGLALQRRQLQGVVADFSTEIEDLIDHLGGLATEFGALLESARTQFGGGDGPSFLDQVEAQVRNARRIGETRDAARRKASVVVAKVVETFGALAMDIRAIRSVDTDMRIIGLNATLKCGRLGDAGRALAVVAHELRACGRRTEENSRAFAQVLTDAETRIASLTALTKTDADDGSPVATVRIDQSVRRLQDLANDGQEAFDRLSESCDRGATLLHDTVANFTLHREMISLMENVDDALLTIEPLISALCTDGAQTDVAQLEADLSALFGRHYTMEQERRIHGGDVATAENPETGPGHAKADDDLDALFF